MSQLRKTIDNNIYPKHAILIGGLLGGISEILVTYPLDTIKTNMQIYPNKYKSIFDCGRQVIKKNGVYGLYNGVIASLSQVGGKAAVRFTTFDYIKNMLRDKEGNISSLNNLLSGMLAGSFESILWTAPTERIKILQQKTANQSKNCDAVHKIVKDLVKDKGISGLYVGTYSTILKQSLSVGSRFWIYDLLKKKCVKDNQTISPGKTIVIGGLSGGLSTIFNHPIDVIKSRIQSQEKGGETIISCYKKIINENGYKGLFKGINARFIRVAIAQAVTFTVYESYILMYK